MERLACFLIGYACGNVLTACILVRRLYGADIFTIGTGNPGAANVTSEYGFKSGLAVLLGDLAKTGLACLLAWLFFRTRLAVAWAGFACILGHSYPLWNHFKGGLGVTCMCLVLLLIDPVFGLFSVAAGLIIMFVTKYLALGGVLIPLFFTICACTLGDPELTVLCILLTLFMLMRHRSIMVYLIFKE